MAKSSTEAQIHTHDWVAERRVATAPFYDTAITGPAWKAYWGAIGDLAGCRVLEYGCGRGDTFPELLHRGARSVIGIDIAPDLVEEAQQQTEHMPENAQVAAVVMDGHHLAFPDGSFERVVGVSILHHLDLDQASCEIQRVLTRTGKPVFLEPLGMNPIINWYRGHTPQYRLKHNSVTPTM